MRKRISTLDQNAFGLIELMTALAVSMIVMLSLGALVQNTRLAATTSSIQDFDSLKNELKLTFGAQNSCLNSFAAPLPSGFPLSTSQPVSISLLGNPISGGTRYGKINVASVTLDPVPTALVAPPNQGNQVLSLSISASLPAGNMGPTNLQASLKIDVSYVAGTMTNCSFGGDPCTDSGPGWTYTIQGGVPICTPPVVGGPPPTGSGTLTTPVADTNDHEDAYCAPGQFATGGTCDGQPGDRIITYVPLIDNSFTPPKPVGWRCGWEVPGSGGLHIATAICGVLQ